MSNKTIKQRIALVAASALTAGFFSVVSAPAANAADGDIAVTGLDYVLTVGTVGSAVSTDGAQTWTVTKSGKVTITFDAVANGYVQLSGPCYFTASTLGSGNTITVASTRVTTPSTTNAVVTIIPTGVGNCIATAYDSASATTASDKLTLTVVADASVGTLSTADSFARLESAASHATGAEITNFGDVSGASRVANGGQGYVGFTLHDANDIAMGASTVVGCSVTGGAVCSFTSSTFLGAAASTTYDGDEYDTIFVAQGVANAAIDTVVTISVNGVPWTTKSMTLLGALAKLELSDDSNLTGGIYGTTSSSDGYFGLRATDSLGRNLTSQATTVAASSYNNSVTGFGTTTTSSSTSLETSVSFTCSSSAGSTKIKVSATNAALATITSNEFTVYCSGDSYSYTAALDKAVYVPGDLATLTITSKDSKGNPASDASVVGNSTYPVSIAGSNMTAVTAPTNTDKFSAGVKKYTYIVGSTEGSYQMAVSLPRIDTAISVPYTIKASSATVSNADVLKSIVSLIASINKQIQALQKLILARR